MRKIGRHPYITEGREIGWDRERGEREREGEGLSDGWVMELLLEDGGRGLLDKLSVELQYYQ